MPPRIARSSVHTAAPKRGTTKARKRNLDAYSIASHHSNERIRIAQHRLGESLDDYPRHKRRRLDEGDENDEYDEDDDDAAGEDGTATRRRHRGIKEEDGVEEGSDSEGNEWRLGGLQEDDEDSDLDSDNAFGESDEERFEGFTFRGSSGSRKKPTPRKQRVLKHDDDGDIDLDESEAAYADEREGEEEEEDFGDEGVDLATMLDDEDDDVLGGDKHLGEFADEESASDKDDEDESSSEAESEDEDDEADDEERLARLRDRVEAMDAADQPSSAAPPADGGVLSVDDLLADLDPTAKKQYAAALKPKKKSQAPKTLSAPLPQRQQDRLNREAASTKAKEQLDRWRDTVVHNRRAEFLSFPLQDPNKSVPIGKERFDVQLAPQNDLEENIQKIMEESGMVSKPGEEPADEEGDLMKAEQLATNKLPVEEVMRRRAELRRARELLFREEIKAKRIAKIKSKSYRRVHRKQKEREAEMEKALLDPEGLGLPMDENEREKLDRMRAEERMGTKHKESKWAKSLKATNRTAWDEGARDSVYEQARRQEELKRRIAGQDISDREEGSGVSSDDEEDDASADGDDDARALRQLRRLQENGSGIGQKGVGAMKFMRDAADRQRAQNDEDVARLRKELAVADGDDEGSGSEMEDQGLGRAIFGPKAQEAQEPQKKVKRPEMEEGDLSEDDDDDTREQAQQPERGVPKREQQTPKAQSKGIPKKENVASGPLARGLGRDRRDPEVKKVDDGHAGSSWLVGETGTKKSKRDKQRERATDDDAVVNTAVVTPADSRAKAKAHRAPKTSGEDGRPTVNGSSSANTEGWQSVPYTNGTHSEHASSPEPENPILNAAQQKSTYHARAFAGDDVHMAFEAEKAEQAASEDEKEISTHLPGWGSWTGDGLSKSIRKANKRQAHNPLFKTKLPGGVKAEDRKDRSLDRVILSEKRDRKGKKYMAPMLPHGFERKEQYERSLRVPVGPEWTTKEVFQTGTRPRVVVKPGAVIDPIERPIM